jgi:stearoyl-CoA desaturase (delta-9 desaturase)
MRMLLFTLLATLAVSQTAMLCTTAYLHRSLSHRAVTFRQPVRFSLRFLTWITTGIRPRQWAAVHRKHHAFTDEPEDPHSPAQLGWLRVQLTNVALYRREARNPDTLNRYAKDIHEDAWDRVLFNRAWLGLGSGITILILVLGPVWGLIAAFLHMNIYLGGNAAVNAMGHRFGRRPYNNSGTNQHWLAILTAGEGNHNNHHAAPTSARLALHRGEIDPGWYFIRVCRTFGLAKVRLNRTVFAAGQRRAAVETVAA